jgi:hypothetical protein
MGATVTWDQLGTPAAPAAPTSAAPEPAVPAPTAPGPLPGAAKKTVTFEELGTPPEGYEPPSVAQDLPSAIGSGAAQGAMGIVGLPGAMTYYTREYVEKPIRRRLQGEQATEDWARGLEEGMTREQRQKIAEGSATPFQAPGGPYTIPTMQGADEWGRENIPGYNYKPGTRLGESGQTAANFAVQSVVGGPKGLLRNVISGAGAGAAAENLGDLGEAYLGGPGKMAGEIGGAVVGDIITHKVIDFGANIGLTSKAAQQQLVDAIRADFAANPELKAKLDAAVKNGEPIYLADYLQGDAARNLLRGNFSPAQQDAMLRINRELEKRKASVQDIVDNKFQSLFGRNLRDTDFATAVNDANDSARTRLYTDLKALPSAQAVNSADLATLARSNGYVADAIDLVNKQFRDGKIPTAWNVNPPMGGMQGNLAYWDLVKREVDHMIKRAAKGEATGNAYAGATEAKQALVGVLDKAVPEYGAVRNQAAEMFGVESSLEGGYKLAQTLAGGSPFKVGEFMQNYGKLRPSERRAFSEGAARFVMQKSGGDMSGMIKYLDNPNVKKTLTGVMGPDKYNALYAKAVSANLMSNAENFAFTSSATGSKIGSFAKDVIGGSMMALPTVPASLVTGSSAAALVSGAAVATGALAGIAMNASERKVANRVVQLAFSTNPKDAKAFSELLAKDYDAVNVVRKLGDYMHSGAQKAIIAAINSEGSTPRNAGGRVARKSGGRATSNPISAEVKRVRALLSEKTASMLSIPDDAIATALHIAKRN